MVSFDGMKAAIVKGNETTPCACILLYGGSSKPGGDGCGIVKAEGPIGKEKIVYWRLPKSQGGGVRINKKRNGIVGDNLSDHLIGR